MNTFADSENAKEKIIYREAEMTRGSEFSSLSLSLSRVNASDASGIEAYDMRPFAYI